MARTRHRTFIQGAPMDPGSAASRCAMTRVVNRWAAAAAPVIVHQSAQTLGLVDLSVGAVISRLEMPTS